MIAQTTVLQREGGNLPLVSKMTYNYDEGDFSDSSLLQNPANVVQHDPSFSAALTTGRGNLTSTTRHDVPNGGTPAVTSSAKYNITGAVVAQISPWTSSATRTVKLDYADSFTDGVVRNTFAYPTKIYDPAANFSEVKYRFDDGANVEAKSPAPAGNTIRKQTKREYDNIGRLIKDKIVNTGAYVRYEYPANMIQSKSFSTIVDTNNSNTADTADEVHSESWTDGAGRTLLSRTEHPGSAGGWSGSLAEYNILGQVKRASVPTEINSNYEPAGDDYPRGWLWNEKEYDWKGRTTSLINTDGTEKSMSYEGCGCAGGLVVTEKGELLPEGRRTQKSYSDILGRVYKTEVLNWDNSVYSTVKSTFNGRDQAVEVKQFDGSDSSTIFQTTLATFDGHGRLKTRHLPEQQNPDGSAAFTTYNYNVDDTTSSVTDARGAATNLVYNDPRGLVTNINYTVPANSNIPVTPSVSLSYDNLGNRTAMTDGIGTVSYEYNQLSQLTAETRDFNDFTTGVPADGFRLEYLYSLSGQLKSYKDPYNRQFDFSFDKVGRGLGVTGTAYAGVSNYTSNQQYRAFGALKQISYGNQTTATMSYNSRLQPSSYRLNDANQILFGKDYYYTTDNNNDNDGLLKKSVHFDNTMSANEQSKRNQVNTYDAVGRIKTSQTGEAVTPFGANFKNGPFQQTYSYDSFGNLTAKNDRDFADFVGCTGCPRTITYSETSVNNRTQSSLSTASNYNQPTFLNNYQYDQDGRLVSRGGDLVTFDASGKMVSRGATTSSPGVSYSFDGDGNMARWDNISPPSYYHLRSSVFEADVLVLNMDGSMEKEFVFSQNGKKLAFLKDNEVIWLHHEPSGKESYEIKQDRTANSKLTYDPSGAPATSNGYTSGGTCPPQSCYNSANEAVSGLVNRGFDGLEVIREWKRSMSYKYNQFEVLLAIMDLTRPDDRKPPTLKRPGKRTAEQLKKLRELAATGRYDSEPRNLSGNPAALIAQENRALDVRIGKILKQMQSDECRSFLERTIGNDGISRLVAQLGDQTKRYSAERSTDISVEQAGLYGPDARGQATSLGGQAGMAFHAVLNMSVSDWFARNSEVLAAVGSEGRVFYRGFDRVRTVLHENLHVSTGLNDVGLAERLGLRTNDGGTYTERDAASRAISQALADNKCT